MKTYKTRFILLCTILMSNVLVGCTQHNESTKSSNAVNSITSSAISEASSSEQSEESKVESSIVETSKVTPVVQSSDEASDTTSKIQLKLNYIKICYFMLHAMN